MINLKQATDRFDKEISNGRNLRLDIIADTAIGYKGLTDFVLSEGNGPNEEVIMKGYSYPSISDAIIAAAIALGNK